jgi:hypothetical protein
MQVAPRQLLEDLIEKRFGRPRDFGRPAGDHRRIAGDEADAVTVLPSMADAKRAA